MMNTNDERLRGVIFLRSRPIGRGFMYFALYTFSMEKSYNVAVNIELGTRIKKIRVKQGKSQDVVADMMGFDRSYWSQIELGKKGMTLAFLLRIANVLDVKIEDIVQGTKESDFES